eukprot:m.187946 g.187946  ORF g.187946 m.187946 type:complete len:68 (+) comp32325_c0_seq4:1232-1435(+)
MPTPSWRTASTYDPLTCSSKWFGALELRGLPSNLCLYSFEIRLSTKNTLEQNLVYQAPVHVCGYEYM